MMTYLKWSLYVRNQKLGLYSRGLDPPGGKEIFASTSMMPAGYLITLCWLDCRGCYQFAGFWEGAFTLQLSPSRHLGFHFVHLYCITTVQPKQFEIAGCVYSFLFFIRMDGIQLCPWLR